MEKQSNITFSIITVCLNAEKVIRSTMESVLEQKYENYEYIIVDGKSTDATISIVQDYAQVNERVKWSSEPDTGVFNAMNKGISRARGDFLIFLNAGDEFHSSDVLTKTVELTKGADIIIGDVAFKMESGLTKHTYPVGIDLLENLEKGKCVCHQVVFASKECLKAGFDEQYTTCADYDWICRQVNVGKRIVKLDAVVTDYDINGITFQTKYQRLHWKEYFEVIERNFPQSRFKHSEEFKKLFVQRKKEHFMYEFMNRWLFLKQQGVNLSSFFLHQQIHSIAIYGVHYMGQRLYDELRATGIEVKYAIDRSLDKLNWEIPIKHPEDVLADVDAVVITPVFDFLEIKDSLSTKLVCPMFSMEEILFYEYGNV